MKFTKIHQIDLRNMLVVDQIIKFSDANFFINKNISPNLQMLIASAIPSLND